jgi:hypothetical protein
MTPPERCTKTAEDVMTPRVAAPERILLLPRLKAAKAAAAATGEASKRLWPRE